MARNRRQRRSAFTLIEVMLVMAIILILAAVALPTLSGLYGDVRVKAAADQVRGSWTEARAHAIEDGRPYRFAVQPGTGKYRVAPDSPDYWGGGGDSGGSGDSGGGAGGGGGVSQDNDNYPPPSIEEGELSSGITFDVDSDLPSDGTWTIVAIFNPDGSCQNDAQISLKEEDDIDPVVIRVRAMTGAITVKKQSGKDQ